MQRTNDEGRTESYLYKARESDESGDGRTLKAKLAELFKTRDELKTATLSWLDSRPLIDELERLQSELETAQNQYNMSDMIVSELESLLETTYMRIRSKKEEELKATKMINEMSQAWDQTREEMERLKLETDGERRARSQLKQVLRLRRQILRTLQLRLRAARIETEAYRASAAEALHHINRSENDNTIVQLTREEYHALKRRAKEETSLADWRNSLSVEQNLATEASRNLALTRLKELNFDNISKRKAMKEVKISCPNARAKAITESDRGNPQQQLKRSKSGNKKKLIKKRKLSFLRQIRSCLVRKIAPVFR